jgi:hypothetical protein
VSKHATAALTAAAELAAGRIESPTRKARVRLVVARAPTSRAEPSAQAAKTQLPPLDDVELKPGLRAHQVATKARLQVVELTRRTN